MSSSNRRSTLDMLEQIQENVTCSICMLPYSDPKMLFCRHEFCKTCLERLVNDCQERPVITCPICRLDTYLSPTEGIAGLQPAFYLQKLLDFETSLQQRLQDVQYCSVHETEKICLFCVPCKALICTSCLLESHNGHQYKEVNEVSQECKKELSAGLGGASKVKQRVKSLTEDFDKRKQEILAQQDKLEAQVNELAKQLQQGIEAKRQSLISDLQKLSAAKLRSLNRRKSDAEEWKARLEDRSSKVLSLLEDGKVDSLIYQTEQSVDEICKTCFGFQQAGIEVNEEANVGIASNLESTLQSISTFASVTACSSCPLKCYAKGTGMTSAFVGEESTVTIYIMNNKTQPCMQGSMNEVEFEITSDLDRKVVRGVAKRTKENQYELSYTPKFKGFHQLSIKIRDQHIYGSPFQVPVKSSLTSLGIPITSITTVPNPCALTINRQGEVLGLSETDQCIFIVEQSGKLIREIEVSAVFSDITLGDDDSIYAVDSVRNKVVKLSPDGTPLYVTIRNMSQRGAGPLKLSNPRGITFNPTNKKIYITNTSHNEIQVLNTDLTHFRTIGQEGEGKLQFRSPRGICCDSSGKVYVADCMNDRIQVFTADGKFVRLLGHSGKRPGCLKTPVSVAIDSERHVYVSERKNNRVSVFEANGGFVKCFGSVESPMGLAVDDNCGTVLVCNYGDNSIQVY